RTLGGKLDVGAGAMAIFARNVTLGTGAKLLGAGGDIAVVATGSSGRIEIQDGARIDVSAAAGGGRIVLSAPGDVVAAGGLIADGDSIPALGGAVLVAAGGMVILHDVTAGGGYQSSAVGTAGRRVVSVVAGTLLTVDGTIDVSHGDCTTCDIRLSAGGDVT